MIHTALSNKQLEQAHVQNIHFYINVVFTEKSCPHHLVLETE